MRCIKSIRYCTGPQKDSVIFENYVYSFNFHPVRFGCLLKLTVHHLTTKTILNSPVTCTDIIQFDSGWCGILYISNSFGIRLYASMCVKWCLHTIPNRSQYQLKFWRMRKRGLANLMFNWFQMAIVAINMNIMGFCCIFLMYTHIVWNGR